MQSAPGLSACAGTRWSSARRCGSGLAAVGRHAQPVAKRVAVDVEVALQPGDRLGGRRADDRGRPERQAGPCPATESRSRRLRWDGSSPPRQHRPAPDARNPSRRAAVSRRQPRVRCGVREERFAVVAEGDPLAIAERLAATPTTLTFALPFTEELGEATEIGMNGLIRRHAPSVARVEEAPASALATIVLVSEIDGIERVLVVVAHPDDCDFGNAATTAKWTDAGVTISYCIVTDGDAGGSDRSASPARRWPRIRRGRADRGRRRGRRHRPHVPRVPGRTAHAEHRAAPRHLAGHPPEAAAARDHAVAGAQLHAHLRQPPRSPRRRRGDPLCACTRMRATRSRTASCSSGGPRALLGGRGLDERGRSASAQDTQVVDVTDTADRKLAALRCHRSQYTDWDALEQRVRGWLEATAKTNGLEPGRLAEQFVVVPTA